MIHEKTKFLARVAYVLVACAPCGVIGFILTRVEALLTGGIVLGGLGLALFFLRDAFRPRK